MKYCSTRGRVQGLSFEEVLFSGFLEDGGMALPEIIPTVSLETLKSWAGLSYRDVVLKIVPFFVSEEELSFGDLEKLVDKALLTFDTPEIAPIAHLSGGLNIFELFHGRTWAFKDLAMSVLGQLFDYFLNKRQKHLTIVVGTSGDTGSAAIEAVRSLKWVDIVVILPRNRCTQIQELQMTTVKEDNVFVYRADGTSDDIDQPIRKMFADVEFVKKYNLCSANSLNWARIMVQTAHFYYAYLKMCPSCDKELEVVVPTGGGGNITAGLVARRMGLPVQFVCAVNSNDIVARMVTTGKCELGDVTPSLAPAMDMQFAYNFERVWYLCSDRNAELVCQMMKEVETGGKTTIPEQLLTQMQSEIKTFVIDDEGIKRILKRCWEENNYLLCPHTATAAGYHYSVLDAGRDPSHPSVCVATASPLKFREAISTTGLQPIDTPRIKELLSAPTYFTDMELTDNWEKILRHRIEVMTENFYARNKA
ncbi:threonine synthase-like 2 [Littorina saxatilis]|uniref:Threonine synthase-like 2 n=1 Tax=Littorina saxatilis TaxID=31220 RepID=A0AAN9GJT9_9CAEN